jgi:hypothetical protein
MASGSMIEWEATGLNSVLRTLIGGSLKATEKLLYDVALAAFADSQQQVPVDEGDLKGSGMVHPPERRGTTVSVLLSYGGPATPYAMLQHEDMELNHPNGGKAKFLEDPVVARAAGLDIRIAGALGALAKAATRI